MNAFIPSTASPALPVATHSERLATLAEQLRLTSVAIGALGQVRGLDEAELSPHVERLAARAAEIMRAVGRLSDDMGTVDDWGLHILFADPEPSPRPTRRVEQSTATLEPLQLLPRIGVHSAPPRVVDPRNLRVEPLPTEGQNDVPPDVAHLALAC